MGSRNNTVCTMQVNMGIFVRNEGKIRHEWKLICYTELRCVGKVVQTQSSMTKLCK